MGTDMIVLSFAVAATAGLIVMAPPIVDRLRRHRVPGGLAEVLAVAVAAQVVTLPIVVMISGQISLVAIVANIVTLSRTVPGNSWTSCGIATTRVRNTSSSSVVTSTPPTSSCPSVGATRRSNSRATVVLP